MKYMNVIELPLSEVIKIAKTKIVLREEEKVIAVVGDHYLNEAKTQVVFEVIAVEDSSPSEEEVEKDKSLPPETH